MRPRGVILDIDGTLIDSNDAHARAWVDAVNESGRDPITFVRVRPLIGMGGDKVLPALTGLTKDEPEGKRLSERSGEIFRSRYLPEIRAFPKVRELLQRMRDAGLTIVVATSSSKENVKGLLDAAGVRDLIEESTSASDAEESKPEPDIVEAAVKSSGHPASELVMLGDTPYDVEAASRAGVRLIAVRCGGWWADDALEGATAIYDDPASLLADYEQSPLSSG